MNKQELIEMLKKRLATGIAYDTSFAGTLKFAIALAEELDEPGREECKVVAVSENEIECQNCYYVFSNEIFTFDEDYEVPGDGFKFCKVNYCPNCGAKIKRGESDE